MDFRYHYTDDQERFRRDVKSWLDTNLPNEPKPTGAQRRPNPTTQEQWRAFRLRLGDKGWLAPTEPTEWGGGGLSQDDAVVLLQELDRRGLRWLVNEATGLLRAVREYGTPAQRRRFPSAVARGELVCWPPSPESTAALDPTSMGVHALRDGDDYILDGADLFAGLDPSPDYLWTLAICEPKALAREALATFLVPAGLKGISIQTSRRLLPGVAHRVMFDQVRVPPHCLLGDEGDGWLLATWSISPELQAVPPQLQDDQVAQLLEYAGAAIHQGAPLSSEPARRQLLMEAYINSRLAALLRTRDAWMGSTGRRLTYHAAQTRQWERRTALRLSQISREVAGIYALLDSQDPRAPAQGSFELLQRKTLSEEVPASAVRGDNAVIAQALGLGDQRQESAIPEPVGKYLPTDRVPNVLESVG